MSTKPWNNDVQSMKYDEVYTDTEDTGKAIPCCLKIKITATNIEKYIKFHESTFSQIKKESEEVDGRLIFKISKGKSPRTATITFFKETGIITAQGKTDLLKYWQDNIQEFTRQLRMDRIDSQKLDTC